MELNAGIDNEVVHHCAGSSEMLGISRNFAYELVKRGQLPSVRLGKRLLIPRVALEKMLAKGKE